MNDAFLSARAATALDTSAWSRSELGRWFGVLDLGCDLLEHVAEDASLSLRGRRHEADEVEHAVTYLSFLVASHAGTACSLLVEGYRAAAAPLFRVIVEAIALGELLRVDRAWATKWLAHKQVPEHEVLRAVRRTDLAAFWGELSRTVHPNFALITTQIVGEEGRTEVSAAGVRHVEHLYKMSANFGLVVRHELSLLQWALPVAWRAEVIQGARVLEGLSDELFAEVHRRWPAAS